MSHRFTWLVVAPLAILAMIYSYRWQTESESEQALAAIEAAQQLAKQGDWIAVYNCYDQPARAKIDAQVEFVRGEYEASFSERTQRLAKLPREELYVVCCQNDVYPVKRMLGATTFSYLDAEAFDVNDESATVCLTSTCVQTLVVLTRENGQWKLSSRNPYQ